jgi:dTDP-glucose 4,6-dehydratase
MRADIEIETDEQRLRPPLSEVERLWASNEKARRLLGWVPEYGQLEGFRRGLAETVAWFGNPANLAVYKTDIYNL